MSRVIAVVEGFTEQSFVREVLGPWLWDGFRVELVASPAGKPGKKGGNNYAKVKRDVINHLKNPHFTAVTTFFDYHGMSPKWPGRAATSKKAQADKPKAVEKAIREDIRKSVGDEAVSRLIPYIQMREFEALLFSEPAHLVNTSKIWSGCCSGSNSLAVRSRAAAELLPEFVGVPRSPSVLQGRTPQISYHE